jgi:carboxypeptidase D
VPSLPDIHQDPEHPLTIFAGHLPSDPDASKLDPKTVTAHLYFVIIKNRRVADKKRIMFWFNVRRESYNPVSFLKYTF